MRSRGSSRKSSRESSGEHIKSIFLSQMLEGIRVRVKPCRGLFTSYLLHNITFLPNVFTCFNHKKILQILEFIHNSCTFVQNISVISFIVQILLSMQQMFLIIILFLSGLFLNKNKTCFWFGQVLTKTSEYVKMILGWKWQPLPPSWAKG